MIAPSQPPANEPQEPRREWDDDKLQRKLDQHFHDEAAVVEMWLKNYSVRSIAFTARMPSKQVRRLIKEARERWMRRKQFDLPNIIAEEVAKIDLVEQKAWIEFEKSQLDAKEKSVTKKGEGTEKKLTTRQKVGDAKFLDVIMRCSEQRCKLLGVFTPPEERAEITVWGVTVVVDTPEQASQILEYEQFKSRIVDATQVTAVEQPVSDLVDKPVEPSRPKLTAYETTDISEL